VIFVGRTPKLVVDKTFLNAKDTPDLSFATWIEPSGDITARVIAELPKPDVKLDAAFPRLTYTHRSWRDADLYFFFNESKPGAVAHRNGGGPRAGARCGIWEPGRFTPWPAPRRRAIPSAFRWCSDPTRRKLWWWGRFPAG